MRRLLLLLALCAAPLFATGHVYWRLDVQSSSSGLASIGQWVSYDSGGSTISTSGGTASASSCYGGCPGTYDATKAFNGTTNCSTFWLGNTNHDQIEMQFASAMAVDHIGITAGCNGGRGPVVLKLQYSDNNSTWTTQNEWDGAKTTVFTASNAAPPSLGIAWRIYQASNGGVSACLGMDNVKFFSGTGGTGAITTTAYAALGSDSYSDGEAPMAAFQNVAQGWNSQTPYPAWWEYDLPTVQTVGSIQVGDDMIGGCQAPGQNSSFNVQYSFDRSSWTTAGSFTSAWSSSPQTFNLTGGPGGFVPQVSPIMVSEYRAR